MDRVNYKNDLGVGELDGVKEKFFSSIYKLNASVKPLQRLRLQNLEKRMIISCSRSTKQVGREIGAQQVCKEA